MKNWCVVLMVFFQTTFAFAGFGVGNGGGGIACTTSGRINSVMPLDLVEATVLYEYHVPRSFSSYQEQVQSQLAKIRSVDSFFSLTLGQEVRAVYDRIKIENNPLPFSVDYFSSFDYTTLARLLKFSCPGSTARLVQIAIDADDESLLQVNKIYWDEMDETNKAALIIHEAIYALIRKQTPLTNSNQVRLLVANLFSDRPVEEYSSLFVLFLGVNPK